MRMPGSLRHEKGFMLQRVWLECRLVARWVIWVACGVGLAGLELWGQAGSVDSQFKVGTGFNSWVTSIAMQSDGKVVIAGNFTNYDGKAATRIARLNVDGSLDTGFFACLSNVTADVRLSPEASGSVLLWGSFSGVNRASWGNVARLTSVGALDTEFVPFSRANDAVDKVFPLANGEVMVAGLFTSYDGVPRFRLARVHANGALDESFDSGTNLSGNLWPMVELRDGKLLIGGTFGASTGVVRTGLARLNRDGSLDESFDGGSGPDSGLDSMAVQSDGAILIAGYRLRSYDGTARYRIGRIQSDGLLDPDFAPDLGVSATPISVVVQGDGKIIAAGAFNVSSLKFGGVVRFNGDGTLDRSFSPPTGFLGAMGDSMNLPPIALQGDAGLIVAGEFYKVGGVLWKGIARLALDDTNAVPPRVTVEPLDQFATAGVDVYLNVAAIGYPRPVYQWYSADGAVPGATNATLEVARVTGSQEGSYSVVASNSEGSATSRVAHVTVRYAVGTLDLAFRPNSAPTDLVRAVGVQADGKVLVGGDYTRWGVFSSGMLGRLNADGSLDTNYVTPKAYPPGGTFVGTILPLEDGTSLVGGRTGWLVRRGIHGALPTAHMLANGALDTNFDGFVDGLSTDVTLTLARTPDGLVQSGGTYHGPGGSYALARVDPVGGWYGEQALFLAQGDEVDVIAVQPDGRILIAGKLTEGGVRGNRLLRLHPDTSKDDSLLPVATDGAIYAIAVQADGKIVLAGAFTHLGDTAVHFIARINADGSIDPALDVGLGPDAEVLTLTLDRSGKMVLGGDFTHFNGGPVGRLVRLEPNGTLDTSFGIGSGANGSVTTVAPRADGGWVIGGAFTQVGGLPYASVACLGGDPESIPSVVIPPVSQTLEAGARVWLGVAASGGGTMQFQWRLDGEEIPGATNADLVISSAVFSQNGSYTVVVRNGHGAVESAAAQVSVAAPIVRPGAVDPSFSYEAAWLDPVGIVCQSNTVFVARAPFVGVMDVLKLDESGVPEVVQPVAMTAPNPAGSHVTPLMAQADGKILVCLNGPQTNPTGEIVRILSSGYQDTSFHSPRFWGSEYFSLQLPDMALLAVGVQNDGRILVGGYFDLADNVSKTNLARLNSDGSLDSSYDAGDGPDAPVYAMVMLEDNKLLIGGMFTNVQGVARGGLARINPDGTLDVSFNPAAGAQGRMPLFPPAVTAVAIQEDRRILAGGYFTSFGGSTNAGIVRLNAGGEVDLSFHPGGGISGGYLSWVRAIVIQPDQKILVGGVFESFGGVARSGIVRLNADGSVDATFDPGWATNGRGLYSMALQGEDRLLVSGYFHRFDGFDRLYCARLFLAGGLTRPQMLIEGFGSCEVRIKVPTEAGSNYTLDYKNTLSDTNWYSLPPAKGDGGVKLLFETTATNHQGYFRVRVE